MKGNGKRLLAILTIAIVAAGGAVGTAQAETVTLFNTQTHTIPVWPDGQPRPESASVSGIGVQYVEGPITDVDLYLNALDAEFMDLLHFLLVSPSGESEVVMSYNCSDEDVGNRFLTFDQSAASEMPDGDDAECPLDTYKPSDGDPSHPFPFEGLPGGPTYTHNFDNFDNENANGMWRLYAFTKGGGCATSQCAAQLEGGWALRIETGPFALDLPGGAVTHGPADPYPQTQIRADDGKVITDLNVWVNGVFHNEPDDIDMVLEKVNGPRVMLMSDACGEYDVNAYGWLFDDEAPAPMPDNGTTNICGATAQRPTDHLPGESLPAPAPPGPYASSLSAFDLTEAGGEYRLWVNDDASGREGFFTHNFQLDMQTRTPPETTIDKAPPARTTKRRATFEFSSSEAGSSFECRLDARRFKSCTSPKTYRRLDRGEHRFRVRATDAAGITDPTPARARWRVTG